MIKLRAKDSKNTFLKILFSLIFILGFYSDAYSLSCASIGGRKPINWHELNHPSLEKGNFEQVTNGEESLTVKLRGYLFYLHKNKLTWESCNPLLVVEPIFFNESYKYIVLSSPSINIQKKIRECAKKDIVFGTRDYKDTSSFPHPEKIKTCEVILEGRVIEEKRPYHDAYYIGFKSSDEITRPVFVTEFIHSIKK